MGYEFSRVYSSFNFGNLTVSHGQHDRTAKENRRRIISIRVLRLPHGAHGAILKAVTSSALPHLGIWLHQAS